jgi:hypothetical protein
MKTPEELKEYIRNKLKRGYPEGELRNDLSSEGYTFEQIQEAIYSPASDPEEKKLDSNPFWYMGSVVIILLGFYRLSTNSGSNTWGMILIIAGIVSLLAKIIIPQFEDPKEKR